MLVVDGISFCSSFQRLFSPQIEEYATAYLDLVKITVLGLTAHILQVHDEAVGVHN